MEISADKELIIENEKNIVPIIIVNTSENADKNEYLEKIKAYETGVILLSDRAIISSNLLANEENIYYSTIFQNDIEGKEELLNLVGVQNLIYICVIFYLTIFIYLFIVYLASNFIDALVLGTLGYLFARIMRLRLKYKATFNIGTYALTLPIILNLIYIIINIFIGFEINYFQWMYTTISYIYVIVAILMIKTEIINQKIQLIKLQAIQEQVSKESEEEIPNDVEEKNKANDKEKKEDSKKQDGEPEGSKA